MPERKLSELIVCFKGAGDLGSGAAWRLYKSNIKKIVMLDLYQPLTVRRRVAFSEAIRTGESEVEGVWGVRAHDIQGVEMAWEEGKIPIMADPDWLIIRKKRLDVIVDSTLAKKNLGTKKSDGNLVIGIGPGFNAGEDVHIVVETNRGHDLGRIITSGMAENDTGVPGSVSGYSHERVFHAPQEGVFVGQREIGDIVNEGDILGRVDDVEIRAEVSGVVRGLLATGTVATKGMKIGDVDPRGEKRYCTTISDKSRSIGGGILEAVLRVYNV